MAQMTNQRYVTAVVRGHREDPRVSSQLETARSHPFVSRGYCWTPASCDQQNLGQVHRVEYPRSSAAAAMRRAIRGKTMRWAASIPYQ